MILSVDYKSNNQKIEIFSSTGGKEFDSELPTIIFLHGAGMDHTVWNLQSRYFAHRCFSVLAVDFPGNGRSKGVCLESIEEMADWIPKVITSARKKSAILVGHSMGALVALESAARYSNFVDGICLIGIADKMPVNDDLLNAAINENPLAYDLITSWGHGLSSHLGKTTVPGLSLIGGGKALMNNVPKEALGIGLNACNRYENGLKAAKEIKCPTLLLLGNEDKMTPAKKGKEIADAISGSNEITIQDCGHMIMLEKPNECLHALNEHFKNILIGDQIL